MPEQLAAEQAALRRVATLVAHGVPPEEVFAAVTEEARGLLAVRHASLTGVLERDGHDLAAADFVQPCLPNVVGIRTRNLCSRER